MSRKNKRLADAVNLKCKNQKMRSINKNVCELFFSSQYKAITKTRATIGLVDLSRDMTKPAK